MTLKGPDGRYLYGIVKVGPKGQIVIPKEAREQHGIKPGDQLIIGGDSMGIAIFTDKQLSELMTKLWRTGTENEGNQDA